MAVLSGFTRSPKFTPCNSFTSRYSSRCKLQKIRSHRSLVQIVQITCVNPQAHRHSSRSTSILLVSCGCPCLPCLPAGLPCLGLRLGGWPCFCCLAFGHGLRWQSKKLPLRLPCCGGGFCLAGWLAFLAAFRAFCWPFVLPALLLLGWRPFVPCWRPFWPLAGWLAYIRRRPCFCPCCLPCAAPIKIGRCAGWLRLLPCPSVGLRLGLRWLASCCL